MPCAALTQLAITRLGVIIAHALLDIPGMDILALMTYVHLRIPYAAKTPLALLMIRQNCALARRDIRVTDTSNQ